MTRPDDSPPSPDALLARYGDVRRRDDTVALEPDRFDTAVGRGDDGRWGAGALVVHDDRVLLVREDDTWFLPGGRLEPGESPEAAARREVREETGVTVEITDLAALTDRTFRRAGGDAAYEFTFATFVAVPETTAIAADPGRPTEGIDAAAWRADVPENTFDRELVVALLAEYG